MIVAHGHPVCRAAFQFVAGNNIAILLLRLSMPNTPDREKLTPAKAKELAGLWTRIFDTSDLNVDEVVNAVRGVLTRHLADRRPQERR